MQFTNMQPKKASTNVVVHFDGKGGNLYTEWKKLSNKHLNVTSGSQQVVTASYQQQVLSTEYGEQLESVYPRKHSQ